MFRYQRHGDRLKSTRELVQKLMDSASRMTPGRLSLLSSLPSSFFLSLSQMIVGQGPTINCAEQKTHFSPVVTWSGVQLANR